LNVGDRWWDHYFDNLSSRLCHQFPLPCSLPSPAHCISQQDATTVFNLGNYEYSYIYRDAPQSFDYARVKFGVYANELKGRLLSWMTGGGGVRYWHNVAHDGSVALLLGLLQVAEMVWPGMGSEVVVELYSGSHGKWYVRVLWGGRVMESSALGRIDMLEAEVFLTYLTDAAGEGARYVVERCGGG
jgi:acid phosphatase